MHSFLSPQLFSVPRSVPAELSKGQADAGLYMARLKRANPISPGTAVPIPSATSCVYSCYIVTLARVVCFAQGKSFIRRPPIRPSIMQMLEEFAPPEAASFSHHGSSPTHSPDSADAPEITHGSGISSGGGIDRVRTRDRSSSSTGLRRRLESDYDRDTAESKALAAAAKLGLKVGRPYTELN